MRRRDVLRALGLSAALPFIPRSAAAAERFAREAHRRAASHAGTLDPAQLALVTTIAEMILPRTDTPGATDLRIPEFIDFLAGEWFTDADRLKFVAGLDAIDVESRATFGGTFVSLGADQRATLLRGFDGSRTALDGPGYAFATIKRLTVYGYFTSRQVAEGVMHEQVIPGRFDGCVTA